MPKKGERQPFRVLYTYPGQPPGKAAFTWRYQAMAEGGKIGQRGADVSICEIDDQGELTTLARFGPGSFHLFEWIHPANHACGMRCRCGYFATLDDTGDDVATHMSQAGLCPECWGTTMVAQRATRDAERTPMAGNLIECPVCQGTGKDADVDYHDVNRNTYYNRLEMLQLTGGQA